MATTMSELFARDPLNLTKEDIDQIIEYYRARRTQFNLGIKDAGAAKKLDEPIDLEELGL
jgi:Holliday junction resolvase